jgi:RNA polymerase sigma-70 factor, ECF subfamily
VRDPSQRYNTVANQDDSTGGSEVTELLLAWSAGDRDALDRLVPLVYGELRRIAHRARRREAAGGTLQTTAIVHEAYLRLVDQTRATWRHQAQFFSIAAQVMRRILVDGARRRRAARRGGGAGHRVELDESRVAVAPPDAPVLALDEALGTLERLDPKLARIVELRFFGGLTIPETAEVLGVSHATIEREWAAARVWLHKQISGG